MKNLLIAAIVGVFLFAGSAAVSWYLMNQQQMAEADLEEDTTDELDPANKITPVSSEVEKVEQMPVALRPDAPLTVESVMELSRSIRKTEAQLKDREEQIKRDEQGLKMLFADLQKEQQELAGLSSQIESKIRTLRELVEKAKIENEKLDATKAELAKSQDNEDEKTDTVPDSLEEEIKRKVKIYSLMPPESVATLLKHKVKEGELRYAGLLLKSFETRTAGKILLALSDPLLADQILEAAKQ